MSTRTLVLCGDKWHPAETVRCGLDALGAAGFAFEFVETDAGWLAARLRDYSVVVLAKANVVSATDDREWLTAESAAAFQNYLQAGCGLVVIHAGTARYEGLAGLRDAVGGTFVSHPPEGDVRLEPAAGHELARGVEVFKVRDEHYFMAFEAARCNVFLRSRSEHGEQPAGWTRIEGGGRVCVLTPGHNLAVWQHPEFKKLLLNALHWAAKTSH